jgi:chitinase
MARTLRLAAAAVAIAVLPVAIVTAARTVAHAATAGYPARYAAPYLEISSADVGDMTADRNATGLSYYTLAFLIPQSGCTPMWENGNYPLGTFTSQVAALQSAGGNVIVSFGGAAGGELAQTCTSVSSLTAAYQNVVNTYGVSRLDFDIEGSPLDDTASITRRDQRSRHSRPPTHPFRSTSRCRSTRPVCRPTLSICSMTPIATASRSTS